MRLVPLAIALLLLAPLAGAAEPNRSSTVFTTQEPILHLGVSDAGVAVAGTADDTPRTGSSIDPNQPVWYMYRYSAGAPNPVWSQDRVGAADDPDCTSTAVTTDCVGSVVAIAVADQSAGSDGIRFVIVADTGSGSVLEYYSSSRGRLSGFTIEEEITSVALAGDGQSLAVGLTIAGGVGGADSGQVRLYNWGGASASWSRDTDDAVTAVATNHDASRTLAAAGNDLVSYDGAGVATVDNLGAVPVVSQVAISGANLEWAVAGYESGDTNLYGNNDAGSDFERMLNLRPDSSAITAAAISGSGAFYAVGDESGKLRVYNNNFLGATNGLIAEIDLSARVTDVEISSDGRYIATAAGSSVKFYRVTATALSEYWSDVLPAPIVQLGITGTGDHVIVSAGDKTYTYNPLKDLSVAAPELPVSVSPGGPGQAQITFENNGNRDAQVILTAQSIPGWSFSFDSSTLFVPAESTSIALLNMVAADNAPAGDAIVEVAVSGALDQEIEIPVLVLQERIWSAVPNGTVNAGIDPGASVSMFIEVTNLGNALDETAFNVTFDNPDWQVTLLPATVRLDPGAMSIVEVIISAPEDAKELDSITVQVAPIASLENKITLTAVVGANFGVAITSAGPGPVAKQGETRAFELVVTNAGNAPDSILLAAGGLPKRWDLSFPEGSDTLHGVQPGQSITVPVVLEIDDETEPGNYHFTIGASSLGDATQSSTLTVLMAIEKADAKDGEDGPAAPLILLIIGLLAAAGARRFRP